MQEGNAKRSDKFERASQVLRNRMSSARNKEEKMRVINQEQEENDFEFENDDSALFYEEDSNNEYLFGNDAPEPSQTNKRQKLRKQISRPNSELAEIVPPREDLPVKRAGSNRAVSQPAEDRKKTTKSRYKKDENVGNQIVNINKIDLIFKQICEPSRTITVNSLGHTLQKHKINFEVKDIVEMIQLYSSLTDPSSVINDPQDDEENLDLSVKLTEAQFKDLYKLIRKRAKK